MDPDDRQDLRAEIRRLKSEVRRLRKALDRLAPPLEVLLRRRGFRVYKQEQPDDLLLPPAPWLDRAYAMLHKYSFRIFLRDVIKHQQQFTPELLARYATARTIRAYPDMLRDWGLADRGGAAGYGLRRRILSFGPTLEWYVAELLKREFGAETLRGVKFKRPAVGGDYDVLAKLDGMLLYVEVKSSPPKQIYDSEVSAFLDRVEDLHPDAAVFFMDTELRMKDKLVPMFEKAMAERSAYPPPVLRLERELFGVGERVFIVNAKESILQNMEFVISRVLAGKNG